nr:hypothetical protein [uncultured Methanospirillum sp.]
MAGWLKVDKTVKGEKSSEKSTSPRGSDDAVKPTSKGPGKKITLKGRVVITPEIKDTIKVLRASGVSNKDISLVLGHERTKYVSDILGDKTKSITQSQYDKLVSLKQGGEVK